MLYNSMKNFKTVLYFGAFLVGMLFASPSVVKAETYSCDCRLGYISKGKGYMAADKAVCNDGFQQPDLATAQAKCATVGSCEAYPGPCKKTPNGGGGTSDRCVCTDTKTAEQKCHISNDIGLCKKGYPGEINCNFEPGNCDDFNTSASGKLGQLKTEAKKILNPVGFMTGKDGVVQLLGRAISFLMFPIGALAMIMYIYAGFLWMSSSPENITKAKSILTWTSLGIVFSLSSYIFVKFVFTNLFG